jgi:hypothetical protein
MRDGCGGIGGIGMTDSTCAIDSDGEPKNGLIAPQMDASAPIVRRHTIGQLSYFSECKTGLILFAEGFLSVTDLDRYKAEFNQVVYQHNSPTVKH